MKKENLFKDVEHLYKLGFAIHLLHKKSKAPIERNWSTAPKLTLEKFKRTFDQHNIGVRLGGVSFIESAFLGVIDCDVKSQQPRHKKEMLEKLAQLLGSDYSDFPTVLSGRGNSSMHVYIRTAKAIESGYRYAQSKDKVKVFMPSVKASKNDIQNLTKSEIDEGYRIRAAWEISIMGDGQQVVLPPSVHPDSGEQYRWMNKPKEADDIPVIELKAPEKKEFKIDDTDFKITPLDLFTSKLSDEIIDEIIDGKNVSDRSESLYKCMHILLRHGYSQNQILTVFTDPDNFLGGVGYDHAQTNNRSRAAKWLAKYVLAKARSNVTYENDFVPLPDLPVDTKEPEIEIISQNWKNNLDRSKDGVIKHSIFNIKMILENECGKFVAFNEFKNASHWLKNTPWGSVANTPVSDEDILKIKLWLSTHWGFEPDKHKVDEAVTLCERDNLYHPVKDYLNSLKWDGVGRVNTWLRDYCGAVGDEKYLAVVGRKTLVAMIARIYDPGCKFDTMIILEGNQGIGKSTVARILASDEFFKDADLNIGDKDTVINMQGCWVYEVGELSAMSRYDVNRLKEFISRQTDHIRMPHAKRAIELPRQCIFVGTTNNMEYLKDVTGNRRYLPVRFLKILIEQLKKDRDQLLAEAKELYEMGESLFISMESKVWDTVTREQLKRVETDETDEIILNHVNEYYDEKYQPAFSLEQVYGNILMEHEALKSMKFDRATQMKIANVLRKGGYEKKHTNGGKKWAKI